MARGGGGLVAVGVRWRVVLLERKGVVWCGGGYRNFWVPKTNKPTTNPLILSTDVKEGQRRNCKKIALVKI